jgi:hypothetical protein
MSTLLEGDHNEHMWTRYWWVHCKDAGLLRGPASAYIDLDSMDVDRRDRVRPSGDDAVRASIEGWGGQQ